MYKKAMCLLVSANLLVLLVCICIPMMKQLQNTNTPVREYKIQLLDLGELDLPENVRKGVGIAERAVSGQRVVGYTLIEQCSTCGFSEEDLDILFRIVEAEAGCEDEDGKLLVANVVLNRVKDEHFPETIQEVVFQKEKGVTQFSPISDGRYYSVQISEETVKAVKRALAGEDLSDGALYFAARKYADSDKMKWFDDNLVFLFCHGGHEFFK